MHVVGIITEYNPFHNGHKYHIEASKAQCGASHAVVAMSGSFVQRGEPAMFPKHLRAKWALQNGADVVFELPTPFSLSSAEGFARGAVALLTGCGLANFLSFGSESGDIDALRSAADFLSENSQALWNSIDDYLRKGLSFPDARSKAASELRPDLSGLLGSPNDILGIEYLRALSHLHSPLSPCAIQRAGAGHDSLSPVKSTASASSIRNRIIQGEDISAFVPQDVACDIASTPPIFLSQLSDTILYALRRMDRDQLRQLSDVGEGLENVFYRACREAANLEQLLAIVKTRRYPLSRLKRICMRALLGISGDSSSYLPGMYLRVLGVRKSSVSFLSQLSKVAAFPVVVNYADLQKLNPAQKALHDLDMRVTEIACLGSRTPAVFDYSAPLIIV